ncbi:MAG: murein biosynthesis integral membrane protein MurJ [Patescibacteria group bacterium]|nr:murein biosynthesis integral membrane protein MurJ [Patescibacteria group bacterium]
MIQKLIHRRSSVWEATVVLAVASLVSRIFGLVRDRSLAAHFGAGDVLDSYFAAFKIPDFIFNLLLLGALSSAFIPLFTEYMQRNGKGEAWSFVNTLINIGVAVLAVILLTIAIFAPQLAHLIAPGFEPDKLDMTVNLMRIMLLSPLFFGISNLAGGILNSFKNFVVYAIAPILYNLGIIIGIWWLVPMFGYIGLAYGVVLGAFMHMLIQIPSVFALGYKYKMHIDWKHPALKKMAWLMTPRIFGVAAQQLSLLANTIIASTLAIGSITVLNLGQNLYSLPVGLFGVSLAIAVFPTLTEKYTLQKIDEFRDDVMASLKRVLFFIIPTMILYWLLRAQIVRLILGSGQFGWEDTRFTVSVLAFLVFGMWAQSIIPLLARSFYALQDTKTPFITSLITLATNVGLALWLIQYYQVVGLAMAISVSAIVNALILFIFLYKKLGGFPLRELGDLIIKSSVGAMTMGLFGYGTLQLMNLIIDTHTFLGLFMQSFVAIVVAAAIYLILASRFNLREVNLVLKPLSRIWKRLST